LHIEQHFALGEVTHPGLMDRRQQVGQKYDYHRPGEHEESRSQTVDTQLPQSRCDHGPESGGNGTFFIQVIDLDGIQLEGLEGPILPGRQHILVIQVDRTAKTVPDGKKVNRNIDKRPSGIQNLFGSLEIPQE